MNKHFLLNIVLLSVFIHSNANKLTIKINKIDCSFEKTNGILDGEYVSYYSNGKLKSKGQFNKNNRIGIWKIYDTLGKIAFERDYKNSLQFIQTIPFQQNSLYNRNNIYDMLSAESIWVRKIFWKSIESEGNSELFMNSNFSKYLLNLYSKNEIKHYKDYRFVNELKENEKVSLNDATIISYKIKEEAIIDLRRFILDYRIIGINPIVKSKSGEIIEVGWLPFHDLNNSIQKENNTYLNDALSVLMNRHYSAINYKTTLTAKSLTNYGKDYEVPEKNNNDYQEISLIEKEHDVWLQFLSTNSKD